MGSKGSTSNSATRTQARLASQLVSESAPLRQALMRNYGNQFSGDSVDLSQSPVFSAGRDVLNQQFQNAEQNIIANTAEGGALLDRLSDNETQRAIAIGNLAAGVTETDLNRAIQLATGATSSAQSGFGSAAAAQAAQAQANASEKAGTGQAIGAAYGALKASDERIKENLERIGTANNGLPLYIGNYLGSERKQLFVLAQEVETAYPFAVTEIEGVKFVDHGAIQWQ